jgi:hypothetical protein
MLGQISYISKSFSIITTLNISSNAFGGDGDHHLGTAGNCENASGLTGNSANKA